MIEELTDSQKALAEFMSELSEEAYFAGWMEGLEYALWKAVVENPFEYGLLQLLYINDAEKSAGKIPLMKWLIKLHTVKINKHLIGFTSPNGEF